MPYQADYVMRLIEQLSGFIRGAKERLGVGKPAELEEVAGEAISLVLGIDPLVASRLSPQTLTAMLELGDVNPEVLPLLAEAIDVDVRSSPSRRPDSRGRHTARPSGRSARGGRA